MLSTKINRILFSLVVVAVVVLTVLNHGPLDEDEYVHERAFVEGRGAMEGDMQEVGTDSIDDESPSLENFGYDEPDENKITAPSEENVVNRPSPTSSMWVIGKKFWPGEEMVVHHNFIGQDSQSGWVELVGAHDPAGEPVSFFDIEEQQGSGVLSADDEGEYLIRSYSRKTGKQLGETIQVTIDCSCMTSHGRVRGKGGRLPWNTGKKKNKNGKNKKPTSRKPSGRKPSPPKKKKPNPGNKKGSRGRKRGPMVFAFRSIKYGNIRSKFGVASPRAFRRGVENSNFDPPGCPQSPGDKLSVPKNISMDCLYLGVYTPSRKKKLPVMVYIHGGNFIFGYGGFYHGARLAVATQTVVVSINYRLGTYGSLYLPGTNAVGNQMLSDQLLALSWVRRNIRHFGGDPRKVTVFGQSAGGTSILGLMASNIPKKKYFQQAIVFSAPINLRSQTPRSWSKWNNEMNKQTGCRAPRLGSRSGNRRYLRCLERLPIEKVISAQTNSLKAIAKKVTKDFKKLAIKLDFGPMLDLGMTMTITVKPGRHRNPYVVIPDEVMNRFRSCINTGRSSIPLIIGSCGDDGFEWLPPQLKVSGFIHFLFKVIVKLRGKGKILRENKHYNCGLFKKNCGDKFENVITDSVFRCPAIGIAKGTSPGKAWVYHFKDFPSYGKHIQKDCHAKGVVCHGCMIPYVWNLDGLMGLKFDKKEKVIVHDVQRVIGHFAHRGKPPTRGKLRWPAVTQRRDNIAVFQNNFHVDRGQKDTKVCNSWFSTGIKGFAMTPPSVCKVGIEKVGFPKPCSSVCKKKGYASAITTGRSKGKPYYFCTIKGKGGFNWTKKRFGIGHKRFCVTARKRSLRFRCACQTKKNHVIFRRSSGAPCSRVCGKVGRHALETGRNTYGCSSNRGGYSGARRSGNTCTMKGSRKKSFMCLCW